MGPLLEQRADQVRALGLLLEVHCPDPKHWHARAGVTCYPPSDAYPWGWVCLPRIEREVDSRDFRKAEQERILRRQQAQRSRDLQADREAARRSRQAAQIVDRIAEAARAARMKEEPCP